MAGDDERPQHGAAVVPIVAANGDAVAGNGQGIADGDLFVVAADAAPAGCAPAAARRA